MIRGIFKFVCLIIMLLIIYNVFGYIFQLKLETFTVGYQSNASAIKNASSIDNASAIDNASKNNQDIPEQNASAIDIHDSKISASDIKSIFNTTDIQNRKNTIMDLSDIYINLCPLDYNINMIKINNIVTRVNQYPGYVEDVFIDLTRQIKSDEPLPTTADFFK